ncbi:MAG: hypothetical protein A3J30_00090 [Candidatus Wildermuthbacteria bacterium RIFCSPLOWO2_02_FULL_47_9c]|uniref:Uncharacterized protein n=2 Tax=Patescibacteria group TaxID=1783273 RepID=A0A0G0YMY3_9BACT|nr:MAG: hypothetical protein UU67_C0090G0001 [Candidatus Daviesbacteria bacterium GW2011_GWB1_41_5]OHA76419.1 MAG: hypothetical protein A3J30_00090 [Candidatus Wildermuthbacteria bacterium RIFCSPLOWO2_02_FULL_47_9c]
MNWFKRNWDLGILLFVLLVFIFLWRFEEAIEFWNLFILNSSYLVEFFGVVFAGFIALFAFLGYVMTEKTRSLVEGILFNPLYIDLSETADGEYKIWMAVQTFNPEVLKSFSWSEIERLLKDALFTDSSRAKLQFEGENYKNAFLRFKSIVQNFARFFWVTIILLFLSLIALVLMPLSDDGTIKFCIAFIGIIVFLLSLFSLFFAALIIHSLFLAPKGEIENFRKVVLRDK